MKKITVIFTSLFLMFFVFASPSFAKVITQDTGEVVISSQEVVDDDLFIGAESVTISGVVNGDVYVGTGKLFFDGTINGDLIAGSGDVTLGGKIRDDVYLGSGNVNVLGSQIGDSLLIGAGNVFLDDKTKIGGSLMVGGGNFDNRAEVGRNLFVGSGTFSLDSKVGGEVRVGAGDIRVGSSSLVGGDFYYMVDDGTTVNVPEGVVAGTVQKLQPNQAYSTDMAKMRSDFEGFGKAAKAGVAFISFAGSLLVGILAIKLFGKTAEKVSEKVFPNFFSNLGVGFLILILTVPVCLILMFTGFGFALASIILSLFFIAVYLSKLVFSLALGNWISKQFNWKKLNVYLNFALGLFVFYLVKMLPGLGALVAFVVTSVGLGVIVKFYKK